MSINECLWTLLNVNEQYWIRMNAYEKSECPETKFFSEYS